MRLDERNKNHITYYFLRLLYDFLHISTLKGQSTKACVADVQRVEESRRREIERDTRVPFSYSPIPTSRFHSSTCVPRAQATHTKQYINFRRSDSGECRAKESGLKKSGKIGRERTFLRLPPIAYAVFFLHTFLRAAPTIWTPRTRNLRSSLSNFQDVPWILRKMCHQGLRALDHSPEERIARKTVERLHNGNVIYFSQTYSLP